jgi:hypothetical protein
MAEAAKKWYDVANTQEEFSLFNELARHPEYTWRSTDGLASSLGWSEEKLGKVMDRFIKQNIILVKTHKETGSKKVAYWERANEAKKVDKEEDLPF